MNGQFPSGGPKTAISKDKRKFTQLIYEICQLPTLILSHRVSEAQATIDTARHVKKLVSDLLGTAYVVIGPHKTAPYDWDRLTTQILQVKLESTVIGPHRIAVKVQFTEAFDSEPQEVTLELQPSLYFQPLPDA